jgi:hypothetical protein
MSWDVFVLNFPEEAETVADTPPDFRPTSIGKRSEIIAKIVQVFPTADFSDPTWGTIQGHDWSIELNMGAIEDCEGFAFHIRGRREAGKVVSAILDHLNLRGVDSETGEFFSIRTKPVDSGLGC